LWLRRFHEERTNPFGLKTYWATRQVLAAISDGAKSRGVLKEELNRRLVLQAGGADSSDDSRALRYLVAGDVKTLPLGIFPPLADASADEIEAPQRDFPLDGGEDEEEDED